MFYFNTENTEDTEMIYKKLCVLRVLCVKKESYELEKLE